VEQETKVGLSLRGVVLWCGRI